MRPAPPTAPFDEPERSYHRRLKDAVRDGELKVLEMRGSEPNDKTLVTRDTLRAYAIYTEWPELLELLIEWERLDKAR
jgi:hypothetical protein